MGEKTGIYFCKCGENIAEKVNVEELVQHFQGKHGDTAEVGAHELLCSEEGKAFLENEIKEKGLGRVVIAACSPRQHEHTFKGVCERAGLNPHMMQMANIREFCAWVTDDAKIATEKARVMVNGAHARIQHHEAIEKNEVAVNPDVLVVGAGVSGLAAAMLLSQKGRKVYVVEKAPCIGGKTVRYEDVFPNLECAPCMLEPIMDEVLHHHSIETNTFCELEEIVGFCGSFTVKIKKKARSVIAEMCFGCAACYEACPVSVPNEFNQNMDDRKAIYVPFTGSLPNVPLVDKANCVRFTKGEDCNLCIESCGFGAIDFSQEDEIQELEVGAIVLATGFEEFDAASLPQFGEGKIAGVVSAMDMERIISSNGPTGGEVALPGGREIKNLAFIHCAGSRSEASKNYCSGVCCLEALKLSHLIKEKSHDIQITHYFADWCLPGIEAQGFFNKVAADGAKMVQLAGVDAVKLEAGSDGAVTVIAKEASGAESKAVVDMVVLSTAMTPGADTKSFSDKLQITLDQFGFFKGEHNRISPVRSNIEGVFLAGASSGPMDIRGATTSGKAAAGEILSALVPGEKLELETITACVNEELCSGCKVCINMCPYKAISFNVEKNVASVNEILCRGCGTCAGACPAQAITSKHFTHKQIFAEIEGVMV